MKFRSWLALVLGATLVLLGSSYLARQAAAQAAIGAITAQQCVSPTHSATLLNTSTSTAVPAIPLTSRRFAVLCNSPENTAGTLMKIRVDGLNPVIGAGNVGDVLQVGNCVAYNIQSTVAIKAISNTSTTYLLSLECK